MDEWRRVFRQGVAPSLSTAGLRALRIALFRDDSRLIQGVTVGVPNATGSASFAFWSPVYAISPSPSQGACPIGLVGWLGDGLETAAEVHDYFADVARVCDELTGEECSMRHFTQFVDDTPRDQMRAQLLAEVDRVLNERDLVAWGTHRDARAKANC